MISFIPEIWIPGINDLSVNLVSILNSRAVRRAALFDALASGAGTSVKLPFIRDFTDLDDEPQKRNGTVVTSNDISDGDNIATILNREFGLDIRAHEIDESGLDPVGFILSRIATARDKRKQKRLLAIIRGIFGVEEIKNGLSTGTYVTDSEPTADNLISPDKFVAATALLGELSDTVTNGGVIWLHPTIRASLIAQDDTGWRHEYSEGKLTLTTYKGIPVHVSNALIIPGQGEGPAHYETYIIAPDTISRGEKPQVGGTPGQSDEIGLATVNWLADVKANKYTFYDRTREIWHINGTKWVAPSTVPAEPFDSPQDSDLQNGENWELSATSVQSLGIVRIESN